MKQKRLIDPVARILGDKYTKCMVDFNKSKTPQEREWNSRTTHDKQYQLMDENIKEEKAIIYSRKNWKDLPKNIQKSMSDRFGVW